MGLAWPGEGLLLLTCAAEQRKPRFSTSQAAYAVCLSAKAVRCRYRDHPHELKGDNDLLVETRPDVIGGGCLSAWSTADCAEAALPARQPARQPGWKELLACLLLRTQLHTLSKTSACCAAIHTAYLEAGATIIETNTVSVKSASLLVRAACSHYAHAVRTTAWLARTSLHCYAMLRPRCLLYKLLLQFNATTTSQQDYQLHIPAEVAHINRTAAQLAKRCTADFMAKHPGDRRCSGLRAAAAVEAVVMPHASSEGASCALNLLHSALELLLGRQRVSDQCPVLRLELQPGPSLSCRAGVFKVLRL